MNYLNIFIEITIIAIIIAALFNLHDIVLYFKKKRLVKQKDCKIGDDWTVEKYVETLKIRVNFSAKFRELIGLLIAIDDESIIKKEFFDGVGTYITIYSKDYPLANPVLIGPLYDTYQMDKEKIEKKIKEIDCAVEYLRKTNQEKIRLHEERMSEVKRQTDLFHLEVMGHD